MPATNVSTSHDISTLIGIDSEPGHPPVAPRAISAISARMRGVEHPEPFPSGAGGAAGESFFDGCHLVDFVLRFVRVRFHRSAFKHGFDEASILHVVNQALVVIDLDSDADPPKALVIGPDSAGNLVEVIWLELDEDALVIPAMALPPFFYNFLPAGEDPTS